MLSYMRRRGAYVARSAALAVALLAAGPGTVQTAAAPPQIAVQVLGSGAVPIHNKWQFHLGDHPAWAAPDFNDSALARYRTAPVEFPGFSLARDNSVTIALHCISITAPPWG